MITVPKNTQNWTAEFFFHSRHSSAAKFCSNYLLSASWRVQRWMVWTCHHFKSLHSASYSHMTRLLCYTLLLPEGAQATGSFLQTKELERKLGRHAGSHHGEESALIFFQDFWREPKSVADGSRMRLRDNLGRAWKACQEAAALKCWAGLHWIKGRRPPPYAPHRYA